MQLRATRLTAIASAAKRFIATFSPSSLFANNEQGVWYDPSDMSTMFQDAAGTLPVTAVEQPVGLMLDKSKGLVLGPELVTNGDFSNGTTGWTAQSSTISVENGQLKVITTGSGQGASTILTFAAEKTYKVTVDVVGGVADYIIGIGLGFGTFNNGQSARLSGNHTVTFYAKTPPSGSGLLLGLFVYGAATTYFDNISVREIAGNHATQTTSTSRPVLSARVNAILNSQEIATAGTWTREGTASAVFSDVNPPTGFTNYSVLTESTANSVHRIYQNIGTAGGGANTLTAIVKSTTCQYLGLNFSTPDGYMAVFDVFNGTLVSITATGAAVPGAASGSVASLGDGWFRIQLNGTASAGFAGIRMYDPTGTTSTYVGTGRSFFVAGMDFRKTNTGVNLPAYQRVNTATDYDTTGFPLYLKFDGVDDFLVTNSINFTATDKMTVFAGVRKLSDAATGVLVESSATVAANAGSFVMAAPNNTGASGNYSIYSRGNIAPSTPANSAITLAPVTSVVSGFYDISGDTMRIRVNGGGEVTNTADQGTGNFGNYPLYIGRRGGTTLPFNGHLYSLIVRGAQSSAGQIGNTESWISEKAKAY